jgi:hypothetical protein
VVQEVADIHIVAAAAEADYIAAADTMMQAAGYTIAVQVCLPRLNVVCLAKTLYPMNYCSHPACSRAY